MFDKMWTLEEVEKALGGGLGIEQKSVTLLK